jgi:hypothetical protein
MVEHYEECSKPQKERPEKVDEGNRVGEEFIVAGLHVRKMGSEDEGKEQINI